ncbi:MAG: hypothetical protein JW910_10810 [Anaerolineae bacterium]|nr:hypothetical protein [Anaerolineae bacterium]
MDRFVPEERVDQIAGGVFLIGLAVLFLTNYWWPGIMFVIGASSLARGMAEGQAWYSVQGALWTIGIGLVFAFGFSWPLLLILIGVSMLLGSVFTPPMLRRNEARKREDAAYPADADDEPPKRKRITLDEEAFGGEVADDEALEPLENLIEAGVYDAPDDEQIN